MGHLLSEQNKAAAKDKKVSDSTIGESIHIDKLPSPVRDYIRLQHEINDRDVGLIKAFIHPDTINSFSQAGEKKVEKERKKNSQWWYEFLMMQIKLFSQIFADTWLKLENAFKQIELMEQELDEMDDLPFDNASADLREKINAAKDELQGYKQTLIKKPEPTEMEMLNIQNKIDERIETLGQYFKNLNSIRQAAQNFIAGSAIYGYFSAQNLLNKDNDEYERAFEHIEMTRTREPLPSYSSQLQTAETLATDQSSEQDATID